MKKTGLKAEAGAPSPRARRKWTSVAAQERLVTLSHQRAPQPTTGLDSGTPRRFWGEKRISCNLGGTSLQMYSGHLGCSEQPTLKLVAIPETPPCKEQATARPLPVGQPRRPQVSEHG